MATGDAGLKKRGANDGAHEYEAEIAALRAERDELRNALEDLQARPGSVGTPDYEWHVELAAKGLAQRDRFPMPTSVTEQRGFYEIMAGAALDAAGVRFLLERIARAERSLESIQEALKQADARVENARHLSTTDAADPWKAIADMTPGGMTASQASRSRPPSVAQRSNGRVTKRQRGFSGLHATLSQGWHRLPSVRRPVRPKQRTLYRP